MQGTILLSFVIPLVITVLVPAATHQSGQVTRPQYLPNEIIVKFHMAIADTLEEQLEFNTSASGLRLSRSLDELNARYRVKKIEPLFKNFKKKRQQLIDLLKKDKTLLSKKEKHLLRRLKRATKVAKVPDLSNIYKIQLELEHRLSLKEVVAAYNNDPDVEYAELNYIVSINATPNDPLYPIQWPLNNIGQIYPESGQYNTPPGTPDCDIDAPEAWDISTGSSEVIVAVVDTGIDYNHRDLQVNMWINGNEIPGNEIDDDGNGYIDDIYGYDFINNDSDPIDDEGHGTHCSGSIAAEGDNGLDIAGVCWNARIMALKFLGSDGYGSTSDAVTAFNYAVENGADVISNSWGGGDYMQSMQDAIDYAHSQGVIMVAAAGNDDSSSPQYPAYYENMIAVAATDSDDHKASFSNYGDWVDIAAPGVDVLSLRAGGTSGGTVYDDYTAIESGTSMACPHVAAACALLLSTNPLLTCNEIYDILMETADPISPGICLSDGRLNLFNSVLKAVPPKGRIYLEHDSYSCSSVISIWLADCNLAGQGNQEVTLATSGDDLETVILTETVATVGVFTGTITTASGDPNIEDGTLQVSHGEIITATYLDSDDGSGNPMIASVTAIADCQPPEIFNVEMDIPGPEPTVTFETDEPATIRVLCGTTCGEPNDIIATDSSFATIHTVRLTGVCPETDYYFMIEAVDLVGNISVNDNNGVCYAFTTDSGPRDIYVPGEYITIQAAIDHSWDGGTVWVADGTYTGAGNRDIDFKGRTITVRSENGPENCIIDCQGTDTEHHRGFYFHSGEDANSILDGFTIINGYLSLDSGGGILCNRSNPTIDNCILSGNRAEWGGGIFNNASSPTVTNCTFSGNTAEYWGGGMENWEASSPTLTNCTFSGNSADDGGGICNDDDSNPTLTDCTFSGNSTIGEGGSGMGNYVSSPTITNCTFNGNSDEGLYNFLSSATITHCTFSYNGGFGMVNGDTSIPTVNNCTFSGNSGGGMQNGYNCIPVVTNCTFSGNSGYGMTNLAWSHVPVTNCTFSGNIGGIYNRYSTPILTNCIFWGNGGGDESSQIYNTDTGGVIVNYSCIQGWTGNLGGIGNIGDDPLFVEADGADNEVGTEDDNLRLLGGSPCIDAGDNDAVPLDTTDLDGDGDVNEPIPFDLEGNPRFVDDPYTPDSGNGTPPVIDMGTYEGPKQGFLLNTNLVTVAEGQTATFTVALAMETLVTVEVTVAVESGDPDITVESGALLIFDSFNYWNPQTVTLAAAEDVDYLHGEALIWVSAVGFVTVGLDARELDNDTTPILYVDSNATGANNGTSWADAFTDLQDALDTAATVPQAEEIRVAQGIYRPTGPDGNREATFQLISGVAVKGGYAGIDANGEIIDPNTRDVEQYETILSGDLKGDDVEVADPANLKDESTRAENSYHVVTGSGTDETAVLDGFTITGGNANGLDANGDGGGMSNISGNPTVLNCTFIGNSACNGGGMYNSRSRPTVVNCTFSGNLGLIYWGIGSGGGIHNSFYSNPALTNCTISGNVSGRGGGIYNLFYSCPTITDCTISSNAAVDGGGMLSEDSSSSTVTDCTVSGNTAIMWGGGINCKEGSNLTISNSTISNNIASSKYASGYGGGGIYFDQSNVTVTNCIIMNNTAIWSGGGIYGNGGNATITNCVFSGNSAQKGPGTPPSLGGGMCNCEGPITNCTFVGNSAADEGGAIYNCVGPITNCIIWGNTALTNPQIYGSLTVKYSCIQDWTGGGEGNIDGDPCLVDDTAGDYHLRWDSDCINAGDPAGNYTGQTDIDGDPRVLYGWIDIGTDEVYPIAGDFEPDEDVDIADLCILADYWLNNCGEPEWCNSCDIDRSGQVDFSDFAIFANRLFSGQ
jgi:parallel beta-helix repeat protein